MKTSRLEAFSDGVIAILITIMVLELHPPEGARLADLTSVVPQFLTYVLSFVYLAIYWNNHHHMFHATRAVSGGILWANLHLLFWLSLIPAVTGWLGKNHGSPWPTAMYGIVLLLSAISYLLLERVIIANPGTGSTLEAAVGRDDAKEWISIAAYSTAIALAFVLPWISDLIYVAMALLWVIPDRRIEAELDAEADPRA
jgi:uncharacterized membrane protein